MNSIMQVVYCLVSILSATRLVYAAPIEVHSNPTYFFTFGNSYTSTGFDPLLTRPSAMNPMGNPPLGQGTSSGGINWVGYLTTVFNASLVLNYDLAVSGACINNSIVKADVRDLVSQVESTFDPIYAERPESTPWTARSAVFAFWIGINDIGNSYETADPDTTVALLLDSYFELVQQVYEKGARQFLFLTVPPTTRSPLIMSRGSADAHAAYVSMYNLQLMLKTEIFKESNSDVTVVLYDAWDFMTKVLDNPQDYGFQNATCIGEGCVWWNDYHPTSAFHKLMAEDMAPNMRKFRSGW